MIYAADFYSTRQGSVLEFYTIVNGQRGSVLRTVPVTGKRHARKVALAAKATPWNF